MYLKNTWRKGKSFGEKFVEFLLLASMLLKTAIIITKILFLFHHTKCGAQAAKSESNGFCIQSQKRLHYSLTHNSPLCLVKKRIEALRNIAAVSVLRAFQ